MRKISEAMAFSPIHCERCGAPPTCFGAYDGDEGEEVGYACDECCIHSQAGGWCRPVEELRERLRAVVDPFIGCPFTDFARARMRKLLADEIDAWIREAEGRL